MQDEVNTKVVAIMIKGGKISAEVLKKALDKFVQEIEKAQKQMQQPKTYRGKQSIEHLMSQNAAISNIEVTDGNIKSFERTASKYGLDFALKFSDHFKVPEQFAKLGDKIVAIPMISKEQQKQESIEQKDFEMNADTSGLAVAGHIGTWHTIDQHEVGGHSFYLMEHDTYGDEAACIIVDERGKLVLDDVYNGFDDETLRLLDLEVKEVPEMPDPTLSVQDMKDYGYAWAGVLPAGQEAAEKALEKGCEVYRLYSDNTEGLCVDAKEIADHAAKGGMLGISKESWMAALEKENYLKAAEMSMEDDYGMIDGIINNGPKEDKTLDAKAPETREKSSIMDRLKAAKGVKQKECCPPKKHKGEIEL